MSASNLMESPEALWDNRGISVIKKQLDFFWQRLKDPGPAGYPAMLPVAI
jgi:hypothetical protein